MTLELTKLARWRPGTDEPILHTMPALPTGTVTFLFTDIAGSTALWERDREAMQAALAQHDANLSLAGRAAAQPEVRSRLGDAFLDELRWALVSRSRDPEADLRERIDCGYAVGDLGDPRLERRTGPHGDYLMPPLVAIPAGTYPIGEDEPLDAVEAAHAAGPVAKVPMPSVPARSDEGVTGVAVACPTLFGTIWLAI